MSINWPSLVTEWVTVQKIYSKMCLNIHHDATDSVNHGMVKNTKTWISWERNIIFLRNKKILNLCLRWHIFSSYRFVAEGTFHTQQCPAGLPLRIILLNLYGKYWGWGRISANSQHFLVSPTRKILNKFTSSTIKSFVPSPSNSNLHLITLYKLHL